MREMAAGEESRDVRMKRLRMRSTRRGIKEMDLILGAFAQGPLDRLGPAEVDLYDALLSENDHDLYRWVSGQAPAPERYLDLVTQIARHQADATGG